MDWGRTVSQALSLRDFRQQGVLCAREEAMLKKGMTGSSGAYITEGSGELAIAELEDCAWCRLP